MSRVGYAEVYSVGKWRAKTVTSFLISRRLHLNFLVLSCTINFGQEPLNLTLSRLTLMNSLLELILLFSQITLKFFNFTVLLDIWLDARFVDPFNLEQQVGVDAVAFDDLLEDFTSGLHHPLHVYTVRDVTSIYAVKLDFELFQLLDEILVPFVALLLLVRVERIVE